MRLRQRQFEQLVQENKQEILKDNQRLSQIDMRLDKKKRDSMKKHRAILLQQ